jgi:hypothetical protein
MKCKTGHIRTVGDPYAEVHPQVWKTHMEEGTNIYHSKLYNFHISVAQFMY